MGKQRTRKRRKPKDTVQPCPVCGYPRSGQVPANDPDKSVGNAPRLRATANPRGIHGYSTGPCLRTIRTSPWERASGEAPSWKGDRDWSKAGAPGTKGQADPSATPPEELAFEALWW